MPSRGRPRSKDADMRILRAALDLVERVGFRAVSMEAIAEEAAVARTTVYRRWPSKATLVMDAFLTEVEPEIDFPAGSSPIESLRDANVSAGACLSKQTRHPGAFPAGRSPVRSRAEIGVSRTVDSDAQSSRNIGDQGRHCGRRTSCRHRPGGTTRCPVRRTLLLAADWHQATHGKACPVSMEHGDDSQSSSLKEQFVGLRLVPSSGFM